MTPRPQFASAVRTTQLTASQELVDLERVRTYHQQRVPPSTKRRPSHPAKESGGPLRFQNVVTLSSPTKKSNPPGHPEDHHHRGWRRNTYTSSASVALNNRRVAQHQRRPDRGWDQRQPAGVDGGQPGLDPGQLIGAEGTGQPPGGGARRDRRLLEQRAAGILTDPVQPGQAVLPDPLPTGIPTSSCPALRPRSRCLSGPMPASKEATIPSRSASSSTAANPARPVASCPRRRSEPAADRAGTPRSSAVRCSPCRSGLRHIGDK